MNGLNCFIWTLTLYIGYELNIDQKLQRLIRRVCDSHEILSPAFPNYSPILVPFLIVWRALDFRDVYYRKRSQIRVEGVIQEHLYQTHVTLWIFWK